MIRIYEVEIDETIENVDDIDENEYFIFNLLKAESIPYKKEIRWKLNGAFYEEEARIKCLLVFVGKEFIEKIKSLLDEELVNEIDESAVSIENLNGFFTEELDDFNNFCVKEMTEMDTVNKCMNLEDYKEMHMEKKIQINRAENIKKILSKIMLFSGILSVLISFICVFTGISIGSEKITADTIDLLLVIPISMLVVLIIGCVYHIYSGLLKKKKQKALEEMIIPSLNLLLEPAKFSTEGITKDFFEDNVNFYSIYGYYNRFSSKNKIVGEYDNKKFIISEVTIEDRDVENIPFVVFDGVFVKHQTERPSHKKVLVNVNCNDSKSEFEVFEDDYVVNGDILNDDFKHKVLELNEKYNKNVTFYFEGNIAYVMIEGFNILVDTNELFMDDLLNEMLLENINIIREYIEASDLV